ncbi:MAG: hypothetical protein A2W90_12010 [Bacteroidetes bacterium GWF2_42_66]|nr:MAG: hypothetical protein A2W92_23415 [Bacteroidetes bacterium GWA2_42_15]OFX99917.1 MAG: hypothetical protein A2W89_16995 [Bacteroidetes bacterium GWE2_42_39]OFY40102.1 MAG: hypothetical protein A2W90_12010 [Bacteroidetes bacterium GWF2_42_66]HBL73924.1 hypothetical protein [Prolixibacteraceae bacterium]HCR89266.1 hypothetical protein [Prolixibacteraceae bacterium]
MIYIFKITTNEYPGFIRLIEIDQENTFSIFHSVIQQSLDFDSDQLASFFIADESWAKRIEVTLIDMGSNGIPHYTMKKTKIKDLIKTKGQKLLYTFDFLNDRSFYIELTEISMERILNEPQVAYQLGKAPKQILTEDVELIDAPDRFFDSYHDYGDLDDYTEIFGEMDDLLEGGY